MRVKASLVRIKGSHPFFGALALFLQHRLDDAIPTACTNGREIVFNPSFVMQLSSAELDGVMVHEILHASLRHCQRCGHRDPKIWNLAADIVVNAIIDELDTLALPDSAIRHPYLGTHEVEKVYAILHKDTHLKKLSSDMLDLVFQGPQDESAEKEFWRSAYGRAQLLCKDYGNIPGALQREMDHLLGATLDWRTILWRYLVRSPVDYDAYDHRFISRGLYVEELNHEQVLVRVCIDTSGSIENRHLLEFLAELDGVARSYPHMDMQFYWADTELHGPYPQEDVGRLRPLGGGGTDFCPFFEHMEQNTDGLGQPLLVYLTDGHGCFPEKPPVSEVLWVLTEDGADQESFPFGQVTRLQSSQGEATRL